MLQIRREGDKKYWQQAYAPTVWLTANKTMSKVTRARKEVILGS